LPRTQAPSLERLQFLLGYSLPNRLACGGYDKLFASVPLRCKRSSCRPQALAHRTSPKYPYELMFSGMCRTVHILVLATFKRVTLYFCICREPNTGFPLIILMFIVTELSCVLTLSGNWNMPMPERRLLQSNKSRM
jgi:hypothetical protein